MTIPNHGGNIYEYPKGIIDFSSNINPLGYPKILEEKISQNFSDLLVYPDIDYKDLRDSVGSYLQVDPAHIFLGNGSVEILDMIISNFKRLVLVEPCFSEYRLRARVHKLEVLSLPLGEDFKINMEDLKANIREGDLVLLTNPNNPTGRTLRSDELLDLYLYIVEKNAYLLLDEAFFEFADLDYDTIDLFRPLGFANIGIIRAATKFFGLPGIRLGYGVFDLDMIRLLEEAKLPWSINSFANLAGGCIFDEDFITKSRAYIFKERERFFGQLKKVKDLKPYKSNANFFLLEIKGKSEEEIFKRLLEKNILVRRCSNYNNLRGTFIRIAIKTQRDNDVFLEAIKEIMEE